VDEISQFTAEWEKAAAQLSALESA
jgi:hypothetical protein